MKTGEIATIAFTTLATVLLATAAYCEWGGQEPSKNMGNYRSFSFYADRPGNAAVNWMQPGNAPVNPSNEFWFDSTGKFNVPGGMNVPDRISVGTNYLTANNLAELSAVSGFTGAVYLTAPIALTANLTLNCDLRPLNGAIITTTGYTLTVNGPFHAGLYQVFAGTGAVTFGIPPVGGILPEWWGAIAGSPGAAATNAAAINAALQSYAAPDVYLSQTGYYYVNSTIGITKNGSILRGSTEGYDGLLWNGTPGGTLLSISTGGNAVGIQVKNLVLNSYGSPCQWLINATNFETGCVMENLYLYGSLGQIFVNNCWYARFNNLHFQNGYDAGANGLPTGLTQAMFNNVYSTYAPLTFLGANGCSFTNFHLVNLGSSAAVGGASPQSLVYLTGNPVTLKDWTVENTNGCGSQANAAAQILYFPGTASVVDVNSFYIEGVYVTSIFKNQSVTSCITFRNSHITACGFSGNLFQYTRGTSVRVENIDFWDQINLPVSPQVLYDTSGGNASEVVRNVQFGFGASVILNGKEYGDPGAAGIGDIGPQTGSYVYPGGIQLPQVVSGLTVTQGGDGMSPYLLIAPGVMQDMNGQLCKIGEVDNASYAAGRGWMFRTGASNGAGNYNVDVEPSGCVFIEPQSLLRSYPKNGRMIVATFTLDASGNITNLASVANTWNGAYTNNYSNRQIYAAAAPTSGTWAVGDRCINTAPTVGQPKSWICTVAGSQGTWVSEGNL